MGFLLKNFISLHRSKVKRFHVEVWVPASLESSEHLAAPVFPFRVVTFGRSFSGSFSGCGFSGSPPAPPRAETCALVCHSPHHSLVPLTQSASLIYTTHLVLGVSGFQPSL